MNIKEAKQEIVRTIQAYRRKDETGTCEIPVEQQRPILLIGPPGIGKTAVMSQIAEECGIGLVSYTITHHTRQSAIGLPMISHHVFDDTEYAVTEYTMSEIVGAIYEKMEKTGIREGILFLDEINCVSETLAPTMLQFLQYKTFGTHRVPEGWIIVTAGNQPIYNRSAREFDVVTLDRVKKMEIEADFAVWKEYALRAGIHGSILSYLNLKQQNFYVIRTELDGRHFVTARGWEDLSRMLYAYEKLGEPVTEPMVSQYLQENEIAADFAAYYDLYRRYRDLYHVDAILTGAPVSDPDLLKDIPFDEKYSLIHLLADGLHQEFRVFVEEEAVQEILYRKLTECRSLWEQRYPVPGMTDSGTAMGSGSSAGSSGSRSGEDLARILRETAAAMRQDLSNRTTAGMIQPEKARQMRLAIHAWEELTADAWGRNPEESGAETKTPGFGSAEEWFNAREEKRQNRAAGTDAHLTNAFTFLRQVYGTGQEMVMFLTELNTDWHCLQFVQSYGNDAYDEYNRILLLHDRREQLRQEIQRMNRWCADQ